MCALHKIDEVNVCHTYLIYNLVLSEEARIGCGPVDASTDAIFQSYGSATATTRASLTANDRTRTVEPHGTNVHALVSGAEPLPLQLSLRIRACKENVP